MDGPMLFQGFAEEGHILAEDMRHVREAGRKAGLKHARAFWASFLAASESQTEKISIVPRQPLTDLEPPK